MDKPINGIHNLVLVLDKLTIDASLVIINPTQMD